MVLIIIVFQTCITVACTCIFVLHCIAWPYDEMNARANKIEAVYLSALMILAYVQSFESNNIRNIISISILLPTYGIGAIFFIVKALKFIKCSKGKHRGEAEPERLEESE